MTAVEYRAPSTRRSYDFPLPPLYPDEPTKSIQRRSQVLMEVVKQYDELSMSFLQTEFQRSLEELDDLIEVAQDSGHLLNRSVWPDYPEIVHFNISNLVPSAKFNAAFEQLLQANDEESKMCLVSCRPDDTFSSAISRILHSLGIQEEFSEASREQICELTCLRLFLVGSERLRGRVLETIIDYFRGCTNDVHVTIVVDSMVCLHRLAPKLKLALKLHEAKCPEDYLEQFLVHLKVNGFELLRLGAGVIQFLVEQVSCSQLPFSRISDILKWCMVRIISNSPYFYLAALQDEECLLEVAKTVKIISPEELMRIGKEAKMALSNNDAIFRILGVLDPSLKSAALLVDLLEPSFGTKPYFDRLATRLSSCSPDVMVRLLVSSEHFIQGEDSPLNSAIRQIIMDWKLNITSQEAVNQVAELIKAEIGQASFFPSTSPLAPFFLYDNVEELKAVFFPDPARSIQSVLKKPFAHFKTSTGSRSSTRLRRADLPDTCRVYRLMLEWQRLVNLHDLYLQFEGQVHGNKRKPTAEQQRGYLARFMQAVAELELKGLWAGVGRKRDTYERQNYCDGPDLLQ